MKKHSKILREVEETEYYCDICNQYIGRVEKEEINKQQLHPGYVSIDSYDQQFYPGFVSVEIPSVSIIVKENEGEGKAMQYVRIMPEENDKKIYYYEACLCESCKEKKIKELQDKIKQVLNEL